MEKLASRAQRKGERVNFSGTGLLGNSRWFNELYHARTINPAREWSWYFCGIS